MADVIFEGLSKFCVAPDSEQLLESYETYIAQGKPIAGYATDDKFAMSVDLRKVIAIQQGKWSNMQRPYQVLVGFVDKPEDYKFPVLLGDYASGELTRPDLLFQKFLNGDTSPVLKYKNGNYSFMIDLRKVTYVAMGN